MPAKGFGFFVDPWFIILVGLALLWVITTRWRGPQAGSGVVIGVDDSEGSKAPERADEYRITHYQPSGEPEIYAPVKAADTSFNAAGVQFVYNGKLIAFDHFKVEAISGPG